MVVLSLFTASPLIMSLQGAQSTSLEEAQSNSVCTHTFQAAERVASDFFEFVNKHDLHAAVLSMTPTQVQVVALFHAQLKIRPRKRIELTERWEYLQHKLVYVPADMIKSPAIPHFAAVADAVDKSALLQAPVVCQLCGAGCLSRQALWKHCDLRHHNWCEYRKRLIFEVQQRNAVPLMPPEKRHLAGNYTQDLLHSHPAGALSNLANVLCGRWWRVQSVQ